MEGVSLVISVPVEHGRDREEEQDDLRGDASQTLVDRTDLSE